MPSYGHAGADHGSLGCKVRVHAGWVPTGSKPCACVRGSATELAREHHGKCLEAIICLLTDDEIRAGLRVITLGLAICSLDCLSTHYLPTIGRGSSADHVLAAAR